MDRVLWEARAVVAMQEAASALAYTEQALQSVVDYYELYGVPEDAGHNAKAALATLRGARMEP